MKNFYILVDALDVIEKNLCEPFTQEDVAKACFCSLSALQKLFRYALHLSIKEYVSKRRMTQAARDLQCGLPVTEIAFKYQYNAPEVFTRAFARVWGTTPSAFKTTWKFTGIFPKIIFNNEGGQFMSRKKVDVSELFEVLRSKIGTYVIFFDINRLSPINEISRDAGDKAIVESLRRIDETASDDMLLFRIGGDEFALVTGLAEEEAVKKLAARILNQNGTPIFHNGRYFPISVSAAATKLEKHMRYSELFGNLQEAIVKSKNETNEVYISRQ